MHTGVLKLNRESSFPLALLWVPLPPCYPCLESSAIPPHGIVETPLLLRVLQLDHADGLELLSQEFLRPGSVVSSSSQLIAHLIRNIRIIISVLF